MIEDDRTVLAFDAEARHYVESSGRPAEGPGSWFDYSKGRLTLAEEFTGNLVLYDSATETWHVAAACAGVFPLYYAEAAEGFVFSSHLRILLRALEHPPDRMGVLEYLRNGYTLAGRSLVKGIQRLLPGQVLRFDGQARTLELSERSSLWSVHTDTYGQVTGDVASAEHLWQALQTSTARSIPQGAPHALMLSGGWDSRTLLGPMLEHLGAGRLRTYSHGEPLSREIRLTRRISADLGVQQIIEPISERSLDLELVHQNFAKVESAIFPHWHWAGRVLAGYGVESVSAGVFGEVLGGHYGGTFVGTSKQRVLALLGGLFSASQHEGRTASQAVAEVASLLRVQPLRRNWYLSEEFWETMDTPERQINADVELALKRFAERGVSSTSHLLEAYFSEYRAAQRIAAQLLSCRSYLDVSFPLASHALLKQASRIPLEEKIHNRLNQQMLKHGAPALLRYPMAATLLPASAPLLLQEASRALRKLLEKLQWTFHGVAGAVVPAPRYAWVNFEFLRGSRLLHDLVADLRLDIWNRREMDAFIASRTTDAAHQPIHPVFDQLMKVYSIDLMFRSGSR